MSLAPGTRIGVYEVSTPLGAGGMGEVYRARDTRLDREVALKVLPSAFASDTDRVARFQREAKTLASLNHPHIAQIFGFEVSEGLLGLAMELVDGEDLAQRLARGPIPVDDALATARQIADALDAAHGAGIIHRDLKPANIKVRDDGTVKVLDFGLAKALALGDGSREAGDETRDSPTITTPAMTQAGVILGTAAYMSPEQARGRLVDKRTDMWAFGCVLYEMLTGRQAFGGETVTDVLGAIVRAEPDWSKLPDDTPSNVRRLLRRCLAKDARNRLQSAGDLRIEIEDGQANADEMDAARIIAAPAPRHTGWLRTLAVAAATAVAASASTVFWAPGDTADPAPPPFRFTLDLPRGAGVVSPAVSRDGRYVAIAARDEAGTQQVWVRALDGTAFEPVPGTSGGSNPFWSPDSAELGFFAGRKLMRVSAQGGTPREIADATRPTGGAIGGAVAATWGADGTILFGASDGVYRVAAAGGEPTRVTTDAVTSKGTRWSGYSWPHWLPQQEGFLYTTLLIGSPVEGALMYEGLSGGASTRLRTGRSRAHYTPDGLVVARAAGLEGLARAPLTVHRFDPARGTLEEPGGELASDASLNFGASDTGVVVYLPAGASADYRFEWVDASGRSLGDGFATVGPNPFNLSRDGTLLAFVESGDIMLRDLSRGVTTRLVHGPGVLQPVLSPDGRRLAYSLNDSGRLGIAVRPTAGGTPETVYESKQVALVEDWSADGRFLAANSVSRGLIIPLDGKQPPMTYADLPPGTNPDESRFSPDGRWLVYNAADSGRQEVYLVPVPPTGERWQLSGAGGSQGRFRRDGTVVFYLASSGELMAVDLEAAPGSHPRIGRPRALFNTGLVMAPNIDQFATTADGTRFLLRRPMSAEATSQLNVIVNWPTLLRRK